jgi:hypothetical protein
VSDSPTDKAHPNLRLSCRNELNYSYLAQRGSHAEEFLS